MGMRAAIGRYGVVLRTVFGVLLAGSLQTEVVAQGEWTFASGADFSSGKYGDVTRTDTWYFPFSAKYETEAWNLKLTVPHVITRGAGNVSGSGADRVALGVAGGARRTVSGLGDVVLSGGHGIYESGALSLDLMGKVKFGTGDAAKGLGTGKNDYTISVEATKPVGRHALFASVGWRKMGDPDGSDFRNPWLASLGFSSRISADTSAGLMADYRQKLMPGSISAREVTGFVTTKLGSGWKLQTYAVAGLAKNSPDFGLGFLVFYTR